MTGLERKSDIVNMAAYAPLLVNTNNREWNPDMIVFDNHRWGQPRHLHEQLALLPHTQGCCSWQIA